MTIRNIESINQSALNVIEKLKSPTKNLGQASDFKSVLQQRFTTAYKLEHLTDTYQNINIKRLPNLTNKNHVSTYV